MGFRVSILGFAVWLKRRRVRASVLQVCLTMSFSTFDEKPRRFLMTIFILKIIFFWELLFRLGFDVLVPSPMETRQISLVNLQHKLEESMWTKSFVL